MRSEKYECVLCYTNNNTGDAPDFYRDLRKGRHLAVFCFNSLDLQTP